MASFYPVKISMKRSALRGLPEPVLTASARGHVSSLLGPLADRVTDQAVARYLTLEPPVAAIIPEFQTIIDELEISYVAGLYFSALSTACVSLERLLNLARAELHPFHPTIKTLYGKGPINSWHLNIDALEEWRYLDPPLAAELWDISDNVRNHYLHSGSIE